VFRWRPDASDEFAIPGELAFDMSWADADRFWLATPSELLLIDAEALLSGSTFEQASVLAFPVSQPDEIVVDHTTGACWLRAHDAAFGTLVEIRAELDGSLSSTPVESAGTPVAIDFEGGLWFGASSTPSVMQSFTVAVDSKVAARAYLSGPAGAQVDPRGGGIWALGIFSLRVSPDGGRCGRSTSRRDSSSCSFTPTRIR
jgi:hypothetical protein